MGSITSANSIFTLGVSSLFPIGQQLQGYAADDMFDTEQIAAAQAVIGVDGILSAGFVYEMVPQTVTLQADSVSGTIFDALYAASQVLVDVYFLSGSIIMPSLGLQWVLNQGVMTRYSPIPMAKKVLQPRKFGLVWQSVTPQPFLAP